MALDPSFAAVPRVGVGYVSVANANRDGTGTTVAAFVAGAAGSKITEIAVKAAVATTAGMIRIFLSNGAVVRLYDEIPVTAVAASATIPTFRDQRFYQNLDLPTGWSVVVSTEKAEGISVYVHGGDL